MQPQSPPFPEDITFAFITSFLLQDLTTQEIIFDLDTVHETPALLTLQLAAERGYVKPKDLVKEPFQRLIMMLWLRRYDITQEHAVKSLRTVVKNRWEMWEVEGPTWEEAGEPRVAVDRGKSKYESKKGWEKLPTIFEAGNAPGQEEEEERRGRY